MTTDVGRQARPGRQVDQSRWRVALLGDFGGGNIGNDASLAAALQLVWRLEPDAAAITCFCPRPQEIADRFGIHARPIHAQRPNGGIFASPVGRALRVPYRGGDVWRALRIMGSFDALVVPGTGILDDYGGAPPSGWPLTLATWLLAARLRGVRTALLDIGVGPLEHPASRQLARVVAHTADYRSYRDAGSRNFLVSLGLDVASDAVVPDIVFSLPAPPHATVPTPPPLVVVPVMKYSGWKQTSQSKSIEDRHIDVTSRFCNWLLRTGYAVRLVIADSHDHEATARVARSITAADPDNSRSRLTTAVADDFDGYLRLVIDATAVVASRYHAVIGALMCGRPTISLGYAVKNAELMTAAGLGAYCQHLENVDEELLRSQFVGLMAHRDRLSPEVMDHVAQFGNRLAAEEHRLSAILSSASPRLTHPAGGIRSAERVPRSS